MYRCRCSSSIVVVEVTNIEIVVKIKYHDLHIGDFFRHYRNIVWGDGTLCRYVIHPRLTVQRAKSSIQIHKRAKLLTNTV